MECIETTLNRLAKYNELLEKISKEVLADNKEAKEILNTYAKYKELLDIIAKLFYPKTPDKKYFEAYLNEIYSSLRKLHKILNGYDKSTVFIRDKCIRDMKECMKRNEYLLEDYLNTLKNFAKKNKTKIPKKFNPGALMDNETIILLSIKSQVYLPLSCENIFLNMVQYKDYVYYVETNDIFSFFYFFRTDDGWYWSPPKKTDLEDVWIECPETTISEGYWKGKTIPSHISEFIVWLGFFFPNVPEFYIKQFSVKKDEQRKSKG